MNEAVPPGSATRASALWPAFLGFFNDKRLRSRAWRIAGAYALFAGLWILFSDQVLRALMSDPELLLHVSLYKGLGFVAATTLLLLILNYRIFGQIEDAHQALITHKAEIERFKRLYAALSQVNESILRTPGRDELFPKVCEALTVQGGFLMAWIGWCEPGSRKIVPVARAGEKSGWLDPVSVELEGRSADQGLGGVLREGRPSICNDRLTETSAHAWPDEAARRGYRSSAVFPIRFKGVVCGALTVYAGEAGYFQDKEAQLLEEAAANISFALDNLEREQEQQRLAQRLQLTRDNLVAAQSVAKMGSWETDIATLKVFWSLETHRIFETNPSVFEPSHQAFLDQVHPDDRERVGKAFERSLSLDGPQEIEHRLLMPDGRTKHIIERWQVFHDEEGRPRRAVGTSQDITERKLAESEIQRTTQLLQAVADNVPDAVYVKDLEGRYLLFNQGAARLAGKEAEEVLGHDDLSLFSQEEARGVREADLEVISSGQPWTTEEVLSLAGQPRAFLTTKAPYRGEDGKIIGTVGISCDITERKQLERQLLRAQRLESIGTLASGIAHDLNNVLAPILMSIDLLRLQEKDARRLDILKIIESSAEHGANLVSQVCSFARGFAGQRIVVQTGHLLRQVAKIVNETFLQGIQLRCEIPADLWTVTGDPNQLQQVLLNLCINARDAMSDGGTLLLAASNQMLGEDCAALSMEATPGPHVVIQVEDNGTGMRPEVVERIFEPFFTTKEPGRGTGLGLSTAGAIVKSHGGFILVKSTPGEGSRFSVYLPAQAGAVCAGDCAPAEELPRGRGEWVLVVDDEMAARQITRQVLEAYGYRVLTAADGAEAVALYASRHQEIALVITDMMMPVMDGAATIQELRRINPAARIIAASGIHAEANVSKAVGVGADGFIPKPCRTEVLLKLLHEVLCRPDLPEGRPGSSGA